jgi:hypothetical protein
VHRDVAWFARPALGIDRETGDAMRTFAIVLVVGCGSGLNYGPVTVSPDTSQPIGLGLTRRYAAAQDICPDDAEEDCDPYVPGVKSVAVQSGTAVSVVLVDHDMGTFDVTAIAEGTAEIFVEGFGDRSRTFEMQVVAVGSAMTR